MSEESSLENMITEPNVEVRFHEIREAIANGSFLLRLPHIYDDLGAVGLHISLLLARRGGGNTDSPFPKGGLAIFLIIPKEIWKHIFGYMNYEVISEYFVIRKWNSNCGFMQEVCDKCSTQTLQRKEFLRRMLKMCRTLLRLEKFANGRGNLLQKLSPKWS